MFMAKIGRSAVARLAGALAAVALVGVAGAQEALDTGDTAWMLTSTALVLLMTLPGLALFYAGLVRKKNVIATLVKTFAVASLSTVLWFAFGYSLAFDPNPNPGLDVFIGGLGKAFFTGIPLEAMSGTIPELLFAVFQMTFAIITPALILGSLVERVKFSAVLWFTGLWLLLVYSPLAHWVWGGGFLANAGVLDFAGGNVVHINAGVSALVAALVLGKRKDFGKAPIVPHNLALTFIGTSLLWVGWFGFNAGSAAGANSLAAVAMVNTQVATAVAALTWMFIEWGVTKKPTIVGSTSGAVAGLVAITPAAGFVEPVGALFIGLIGAAAAYLAVSKLKAALGYDDSLDVFGIHGVAGIVGAIGTAVFASPSLGGVGYADGMSMGSQIWTQIVAVVITIVWCGVVSAILYKVVDAIIGLRPTREEETLGLDLASHGEVAYHS